MAQNLPKEVDAHHLIYINHNSAVVITTTHYKINDPVNN